MDIQLFYKYLVVFLYAALATYWFTPSILRKLTKTGFVRPDKYKKGKNATFVTMAGIAMLVGILVSLSLSQILMISQDLLGKLFIFYFIVMVYALYGIYDDLFGSADGDSHFFSRYNKIILIFILSFPVASLITDTYISVFGLGLELGWVYALIIAPFYIMVIANLINVHAGYNGLITGTSWLILLSIIIKGFMLSGLDNILFLLPVFGALTGFIPYNLFPAKAHDGNVGAFMLGGAIGASLLALNLEWFGVFIFIPHIINFLMDTWTLVIKKKKDVKFGHIRDDGTIQAPPTMKYKSLKFLIVSWFRLTEPQATRWLWLLTAIFCALGIIIF